MPRGRRSATAACRRSRRQRRRLCCEVHDARRQRRRGRWSDARRQRWRGRRSDISPQRCLSPQRSAAKRASRVRTQRHPRHGTAPGVAKYWSLKMSLDSAGMSRIHEEQFPYTSSPTRVKPRAVRKRPPAPSRVADNSGILSRIADSADAAGRWCHQELQWNSVHSRARNQA